MFFIVARLIFFAFTIPFKSPLTKVISALSIATSVPVPIAIPTLACAKAGESLMPIPTLPDSVDNNPVNVEERLIRQFDCPNPECDESLDITNVNVGTKIKCTTCGNVTWLPDYGKKWWQKPDSIIGGLIVSFVIGVLASITANWISDSDASETQALEQVEQKKLLTNSSSGRAKGARR